MSLISVLIYAIAEMTFKLNFQCPTSNCFYAIAITNLRLEFSHILNSQSIYTCPFSLTFTVGQRHAYNVKKQNESACRTSYLTALASCFISVTVCELFTYDRPKCCRLIFLYNNNKVKVMTYDNTDYFIRWQILYLIITEYGGSFAYCYRVINKRSIRTYIQYLLSHFQDMKCLTF